MRVLVVSAHPDDEVIGAGGTLLRHVDHGDDVYWAVFTQAYTPQWPEKELVKAKEQVYEVRDALGAKKVFLLGFPTVKLNIVPQIDLTMALQRVIDEVAPEVVYTTPKNDLNQDHRVVHDATLVATRPLPATSVKRVLSYEIATTSRFGYPSGAIAFQPTVFVDITPYLDRKLELMGIYQTEIKEYPHPRSKRGLEIFYRERGLSVGLEAAECFELDREIVS